MLVDVYIVDSQSMRAGVGRRKNNKYTPMRFDKRSSLLGQQPPINWPPTEVSDLEAIFRDTRLRMQQVHGCGIVEAAAELYATTRVT